MVKKQCENTVLYPRTWRRISRSFNGAPTFLLSLEH